MLKVRHRGWWVQKVGEPTEWEVPTPGFRGGTSQGMGAPTKWGGPGRAEGAPGGGCREPLGVRGVTWPG
ncbi:hypothetical protein GCM10009745_17750 [Kribbella yunnanensis]|uniref:Uncharacterized protein n=1 Tax=Kribbella yunnanensis TaxID=190194 RepID=A0ABN2GQC3_9ACTN